jgi:hypothetical protein
MEKETSRPERPPLTGLSSEQEQSETARWFKLFATSPERAEQLKADFRLEQILILTENEKLKETYLEKILDHTENLLTKKREKISFKAEFASIHALLTVGEILKQNSPPYLLHRFAPRLYSFSKIKNPVVSGIAHQQFLNVLGTLPTKDQKRKLLEQLEI